MDFATLRVTGTRRAPRLTQATSRAPGGPVNTRRILLIDDNPNDVELALTALDEVATGGAVSVASSGPEAMATLRRARDEDRLPDLILLDLKMPHMDGIAILDAIRAERGLDGIPVVMLTTSGENRDIRESYAHGASAYVVKPLDFTQFREALRTIQAFWTSLNRPPRTN